jgi:hypothetical protein
VSLTGDLLATRDRVVIDAGGRAAPLCEVMDDFQRDWLSQITPALLRIMGYPAPAEGVKARSWLEMPRGHGKTFLCALAATFALALSRRPIRAVVAASDRDQARELRHSVAVLTRLNGWLDAARKSSPPGGGPPRRGLLRVENDKVVNDASGSWLEIISSDESSSYGILADLIICDEACHWTRGEGLWTSLLSAAGKKKDAVLLVITNAGFLDSWQWALREKVRQDPAWIFSRLDGPRASWLGADQLAEQRRLLPEIAYRRLWLNEWSGNSGDALSEDDVQGAMRLAGPGLFGPGAGRAYYAGLDLGLRKDSSCLAVLGAAVPWTERRAIDRPPRRLPGALSAAADLGLIELPPEPPAYEEIRHPGDGLLRLEQLRLWRPQPGRQVSLTEVEDAVLEADRQYRFEGVCVDAWQAVGMAERLTAAGLPVTTVAFTGGVMQQMSGLLLNGINDGSLRLFPHPSLLSDLKRLRVKATAQGWRLESPRGGPADANATGHGDTVAALSLALLAAKRSAYSGRAQAQRELVCWPA